MSDSHLSFRSIFLHAWDLADEGVEFFADSMRKTGLNTLCLASTYHHGWFIHPHSSSHRAFFAEGDVCFFHPQNHLYANTRLKPQLSRMAADTDWFAALAKHADSDMQVVAWTVGAHNTRLGLAFPELTVANVYGDRLPHALCPANNEVREYLKALVRDLATSYRLWGVQLEAFEWLGFAHGHHHERDLVGITPFEQELMGLCVCPACTTQATQAGVDMVSVVNMIKGILDGVFREAPQRPKNQPRSMAELEAMHPHFKAFNAWRKKFLVSLISEIKQQSLRGTNCRLLLQTGFVPEMADFVDGFACAAYQQTPDQTLAICQKAHQALPSSWNGLFQCFIQLGMGVPESEEQLKSIIDAVGQGGCNGINFYNHSEAPPKMLKWLANVLPKLSSAQQSMLRAREKSIA